MPKTAAQRKRERAEYHKKLEEAKALAPKRPPGRPTKFYKEVCELTEKLCLLGASNNQISDCLGISHETLNEWLNSNKEFADAMKRGRIIADASIANSLYQRAKGYTHKDTHVSNYQGNVTLTPIEKHYPPDTAAASLWLRNRQPKLWRDSMEHQHQHDLQVSVSSIELARRVYHLLNQQHRTIDVPALEDAST